MTHRPRTPIDPEVGPRLAAATPCRSFRRAPPRAGARGRAGWSTILGIVAIAALLLPSVDAPGPGASGGAADDQVTPLLSTEAALAGGSGPLPKGTAVCPAADAVVVDCSASAARGGHSVPVLGFQASSDGGAAPPSTALASLVWDPAIDAVVLFGGWAGGRAANQTWLFTNGSWTNHTDPSAAPPARFGAQMAYDAEPSVKGVVLFGGCGRICPMNDTWVFSNGSWQELPRTDPAPPPLYDAAMASWGAGGTLLFGGCLDAGCLEESNGTWSFQGSASCAAFGTSSCWVELDGSGPLGGPSPPGLAGAALADDPLVGPANGTLVLYGGFHRSCAGCAARDSNGTWWFTGPHWINATDSYAGGAYPAAGRSFASLFWDPFSKALYLYGGVSESSGTTFAQLWENEVYAWVNASPTAVPSARSAISTASGGAPGPGPIEPAILFGGNGSGGPPQNTTLVFERSVVSSANFEPTSPETNQTVHFFSNSTGGTAPAASWSFGTGAVSSGGNCTENFAVAGTVSATLTAVDRFGVREVTDLTVPVRAPTVQISSLPVADVGLSTSFAADASNTTGPVAFAWNFSNGATAQGPNITVTFAQPGTVSVTVAARDGTGSTAIAVTSVHVNPPISGSVRSTPPQVDAGAFARLEASVAGGTPPLAYRWALPGGRVSSGPNSTVEGASPGNLSVSLRVVDALGAAWTTGMTVRVNPELVANASATPPTGFSGGATRFSSEVAGGTPPYQFAWSFGDGSRSTDPSPTHAYATSGTFHVDLWVNDSGNGSSHISLETRAPKVSRGLLSQYAGLPLLVRLEWVIGIEAVGAFVLALLIQRQGRRPRPPRPPSAR